MSNEYPPKNGPSLKYESLGLWSVGGGGGGNGYGNDSVIIHSLKTNTSVVP